MMSNNDRENRTRIVVAVTCYNAIRPANEAELICGLTAAKSGCTASNTNG
ncbi:hypothetical protein ACVJGD_000642 [Bradyrhizobium sp. USDA 10063]